MAVSKRRILLADASKLGRTDLAVIAPVADFDTLIVSGDVDEAIVRELGQLLPDVRLAR